MFCITKSSREVRRVKQDQQTVDETWDPLDILQSTECPHLRTETTRSSRTVELGANAASLARTLVERHHGASLKDPTKDPHSTPLIVTLRRCSLNGVIVPP